MAVIKLGDAGWRRIDDAWQPIDRVTDLEDGRPALVSLDLWQEARARLGDHNAPLGLRLASHQSPALVVADLARFSLVALDFPRFVDGRAYSYARLLQERFAFKGEIRAVGNVLFDQLYLMQRCGFSALEIQDDKVQAWLAAFSEPSFSYQPTGDRRIPVWELRRQRRVAAAE